MATGRPSQKQRSAFGRRLLAARETTGLSQAKIAEKLGITQHAYAYWERETKALKPEQLVKLSEILNVSVDELMGKPVVKKKGSGPAGKLRQVFDEASRLPRHQQNKVVEFLENYLRGLDNKAA